MLSQRSLEGTQGVSSFGQKLEGSQRSRCEGMSELSMLIAATIQERGVEMYNNDY